VADAQVRTGRAEDWGLRAEWEMRRVGEGEKDQSADECRWAQRVGNKLLIADG